jgi:DNA-binding GntR family transcriptional regulator
VYEVLRDRIVDGELAADTKLVQEQLAERLGVSRTPVRDALTRLASEGLVTLVPGSGYLVNDLTEQDVTDVHQVRESLELLGVRLACGRHSTAELARLRALVEEMAAEDDATSSRHFELNRQFHSALIEPCGNPLLLQMVNSLWDHPVNRRITRSYVHEPAHVSQMVAEHRQIIEAAAEKDVDRLVALVAEHIRAGYTEALPSS